MHLTIHHDRPAWPKCWEQRSQKRKELAAAMKRELLGKNDSLEWPGHYEEVARAAQDVGIKVTMRKLNGTGWRVWRVFT